MKKRYFFWLFLAILAGITTHLKLEQIQQPIPIFHILGFSGAIFCLAVAISAHGHRNNCEFDPDECDNYYFWIIAIIGIVNPDPGLTYFLLIVVTGASTTGSFITWNRQRIAKKKYIKK